MQTPPGQSQINAPPIPAIAVPTQVAAPVAVPAAGAALTLRDLEAIRSRRSELSSQLQSSANRRQRLISQLNRQPAGLPRVGIEQRVAVLDKRIVQIETDIAETGRQLTTAQAGLLTATQDQSTFGGMSSRQVSTMSDLFIVFVLAPLAFSAARNMWRRGNRPPPARHDAENERKLDQLQQSIDTIAIEVERVSEGQRFVTKLMSGHQAMPAVGAGQNQREMTTIGRSE